MTGAPSTTDELLALFEVAERTLDGGELDEPVAFTDHGLQCAMALRRAAPHDVELQIAGLVHDLGHLLADGTADTHGRDGAGLVLPLLGSRVARLVEMHVPAKRYLVATDPSYRRRLSPASAATLARQGGAMTTSEADAFAAEPMAASALALRRADEAAKRPDWVVPGLGWWEPLVRSVANEG